MANINHNTLTKLDTTNPDALRAIFDAMLEDLAERRKPRDIGLFYHCVEQVIPDDIANSKLVEDFVEIAGVAFRDYHNERAKGAHLEDGKIVYPAADTDTNTDADEDDLIEDEDADGEDILAAELEIDPLAEDPLHQLMRDRAVEMGVEVKG